MDQNLKPCVTSKYHNNCCIYPIFPYVLYFLSLSPFLLYDVSDWFTKWKSRQRPDIFHVICHLWHLSFVGASINGWLLITVCHTILTVEPAFGSLFLCINVVTGRPISCVRFGSCTFIHQDHALSYIRISKWKDTYRPGSVLCRSIKRWHLGLCRDSTTCGVPTKSVISVM